MTAADPTTVQVHGTAVAIAGAGLLIRGPSGAGKSDLALRLIDAGARLVADDRCELRRAARGLEARAPARLSGLLEVRGLGIVSLPAAGPVPLALVAELVPPGRVERLPLPSHYECLGVMVPRILIAPFEASAAAKLRLAVREASRSQQGPT